MNNYLLQLLQRIRGQEATGAPQMSAPMMEDPQGIYGQGGGATSMQAPVSMPQGMPQGAPQDMGGVGAAQIDPSMMYGSQPAPDGSAELHPAVQAIQKHFGLLNLLRNQRNQQMQGAQDAYSQG